MWKKVLLSGVAGGIVLFVWTFIANAIFLFHSRMEMKQIPDERAVHEVLKKTITAPGKYICNPAVIPEKGFPYGEPVFSIQYSGFGHEAAGGILGFHLLIFWATATLAAWMLANASARILSRYTRRVVFFVGIGLLIAVFNDLDKFGIAEFSLRDALILASYDIVTWAVIGLAVAGVMRPASNMVTHE